MREEACAFSSVRQPSTHASHEDIKEESGFGPRKALTLEWKVDMKGSHYNSMRNGIVLGTSSVRCQKGNG